MMNATLQEKLEDLVEGFRGEVGIYVRHLRTGEAAAIDADTLFPTASMIKVPIAVGVFDRIQRGELALDRKLAYDPDEIAYSPGEDIIASLRPGESVTVGKLMLLMLTLSDNNASLWLQGLVSGERINELMKANSFDEIKVNSRTEGRRGDWERLGWGQTTPRQMAELLIAIREERIVSPWASQALYRYLCGSYYREEALSQIPPFVQVASKQGAVNQSRSEVVLVNAPSGDYVFCVATNHQEDESWKPGNEGYVLIRGISRMLWEHFEPDSAWAPAGAPKK